VTQTGTGSVVWITGRPSAGKSTLAQRLHQALRERGVPCCVLDGDAVRAALVPSPGYGSDERRSFYASLAQIAALLAKQNLIVLVPATAHSRSYREHARSVSPRYVEVYVDVSPEDAVERDGKGLYRAARQGSVRGLPGADAVYEEPLSPDVVASGGYDAAAIARVLGLVGSAP
jgi:adenylylsulfate kinase